MLAKEFLSSWIFERLDIFKITNVNISKNKIGIKAKIEKFLKIKNKISSPLFKEFNAHGKNKNKKFNEIKIFASIFRKKL